MCRRFMAICLAVLLTAFVAPAMAADTCVASTDIIKVQGEVPQGRIYLAKVDSQPRSAVIYQGPTYWVIAFGNSIPAEGTAINLQGDGVRCDSLAAAEDWLKLHAVTAPRPAATPRIKVMVASCRLDPVLTATVKDHPHPFSEGHRVQVGVVARGGPWLASVDAQGSWNILVGTYYDRRGVRVERSGPEDLAPPVLVLSGRQVYTCKSRAAANGLYAAEVAKARSMPLAAGATYWTSNDEASRFKSLQ